jgi:hypothetical protein
MHRLFSALTLFCLVFLPGAAALAQESSLDTELDLSLAFMNFADTDLDQTYGYLPMFGAGLSFTMAPRTRLFLAVGYGHKSGDPYYDSPGFQGDSEASLKTLRSRLGLKFDLAQSSVMKVYAGFAFLVDYARESLPPQVTSGGGLDDSPASGLVPGFLLSFAPEWRLGDSGRSLGLEVGYGGTRGDLQGDSHGHDIDLTGFSGRVYLVLGL